MSRFVKGLGKGAAGIVGDSIKKAFSVILGEIVAEIIKETGVKDIAQEKMMATGFKVVKDLGIDPKNVQRELIKGALKKELGLK